MTVNITASVRRFDYRSRSTVLIHLKNWYIFDFFVNELPLSRIYQSSKFVCIRTYINRPKFRRKRSSTQVPNLISKRVFTFPYLFKRTATNPTVQQKEGNVLFNDALNTFYLLLYGVGSPAFQIQLSVFLVWNCPSESQDFVLKVMNHKQASSEQDPFNPQCSNHWSPHT